MNAKKLLLKAARGKKEKARIESMSEDEARKEILTFVQIRYGLTDEQMEERKENADKKLAEIDAIVRQRDMDVLPNWTHKEDNKC